MAQPVRLSIDVGKVIADLTAVARAFELHNKIYKALFRGKGLEFDGYRDYSPQDDSSLIDWKATMKSNRVLVKKYIEERDLKIVFVLDVSERMVFGSTPKLKCEYAGEVVAGLAHLIMDSHDMVGLIMYNDAVVDFIPPKKSQHHFDLLMDTISNAVHYKGESNFDKLLNFLVESLDKKIHSLVFVSDFLRLTPASAQNLGLLSGKYEVMGIMVRDPLDMDLPNINREILIEDPITRQQLLINPSIYRAEYALQARKQEAFVKELFHRSDIDLLSLTTDTPFFVPMARFLRDRVDRRGDVV